MLRVCGVKAKKKYAFCATSLFFYVDSFSKLTTQYRRGQFDKGVSTKTGLKKTMVFRQKSTILAQRFTS